MPVEAGPDQPFQHVSRNVNKIVEQLQKGYSNFRPNDYWAPNVNLYETDEMYLVCVDLAGVDKNKLDLELANDRLTLRGTRAVPTFDGPDGAAPLANEKSKLKVHLMEIDHGAFYREVELPEQVAQAKIAAHYRNGMLWIELPKK
jgi:HSP20 family protein